MVVKTKSHISTELLETVEEEVLKVKTVKQIFAKPENSKEHDI